MTRNEALKIRGAITDIEALGQIARAMESDCYLDSPSNEAYAAAFLALSDRKGEPKPEWLAKIETVNREALAEGLSYGRYLARELERESLKRRRGD